MFEFVVYGRLTIGASCQKKVSVSQLWREGGKYGYKGAAFMID